MIWGVICPKSRRMWRVMYLGTIVERGPVRDVLKDPQHPYSARAVAGDPVARPAVAAFCTPCRVTYPAPRLGPRAALFHTRCAEMKPGLCDVTAPPETLFGASRSVRCHLAAPALAQTA